MNGILKCEYCYRSLIEEDLEDHVCRKAKGFHIKGDVLWLPDGIEEYPLKLSAIQKDIESGKIRFPPKGNNDDDNDDNRRGNSTFICHLMLFTRIFSWLRRWLYKSSFGRFWWRNLLGSSKTYCSNYH